MGELRGTVESISIRSLRVRHHRGAVHTIPFGELKSLTNYSRDWVIMKLEFRVGFRCRSLAGQEDREADRARSCRKTPITAITFFSR